MAKLDEQIKTMAGYFAADCEADGRLSLVLEVEHFITCSDGRAADFAAVQAAMQDMQQQADAPIIVDGTYMGYSGLAASVTMGPACLGAGLPPHHPRRGPAPGAAHPG